MPYDRGRFVPWRESRAYRAIDRWRERLEPADVVIAVLPSTLPRRPAISAHILQGCVEDRTGHRVAVFYAHLFYAAWISEQLYTSFAQVPAKYFLTERLFASSAFDLPPLGRNAENALEPMWQEKALANTFPYFCHENFLFLARETEQWTRDMASLALAYQPRIVGATSMFEQINSSLGFHRAIKDLSPQTCTVLGGANCLDEMADGLAELPTSIDHFFSGECETVFPGFVTQTLDGDPETAPPERILRGSPCLDMDAIPCPDYDEFYAQLELVLPGTRTRRRSLWLPYESSRGCWWGAKDTCLFCGLNGDMLTHRQKSPEKVLDELLYLTRSYPPTKIMAYDNIMPFSYFKTLLPAMKGKFEGYRFFYEQKSNLKLAQMRALADANVTFILPGIEAVSTSLLRRMHKGVSASQNIACLRYAQACGVSVSWNLLYGFPGDIEEEYLETLELLPLLRHLNPPAQLTRVHLDRFSPYFTHPERYGIESLEPLDGYRDFLPSGAPIAQIAYQFESRFVSTASENPDLTTALEEAVVSWRRAWVDEQSVHTFNISNVMAGGTRLDPSRFPVLRVEHQGGDRFLLFDSRGLPGLPARRQIGPDQARAALAPRKLSLRDDPAVRWALDAKLAVELDGKFTPLATATPDLIEAFEGWRSTPPALLARHSSSAPSPTAGPRR